MKLIELIDNSDLNQVQKNVTKGFVLRAKENDEQEKQDRNLIEENYNKRINFDVIVSTEELKIFRIRNSKESWDIKYPYRTIYFKKGKWHRVNIVSPSLDTAYLVYLGEKELGSNSQFADFAMKMLEIKIED